MKSFLGVAEPCDLQRLDQIFRPSFWQNRNVARWSSFVGLAFLALSVCLHSGNSRQGSTRHSGRLGRATLSKPPEWMLNIQRMIERCSPFSTGWQATTHSVGPSFGDASATLCKQPYSRQPERLPTISTS